MKKILKKILKGILFAVSFIAAGFMLFALWDIYKEKDRLNLIDNEEKLKLPAINRELYLNRIKKIKHDHHIQTWNDTLEAVRRIVK